MQEQPPPDHHDSPAPPPAPPDSVPATTALSPPARPGSWSAASLAAVAAALICGALMTLAVMTARPSAGDVASPAVPVPARPGTPAALPVPAPVDPASAPTWADARQARWVGSTRQGVALELAARRPVNVWHGTVTPLLVVRCLDRRADVFVYTDTAAQIEREDDNHAVRLGFDDQPEAEDRWPDSMEHDALFAPDGDALVRRLVAARTLRFGFTPHNAAPVTAVFDVAGLAERIAPLARRCGMTF
jgi:hypothetical protein